MKEKNRLEEKEIDELKHYLIDHLSQGEAPDYMKNDRESAIWRNFAAGSPRGGQVYHSFTDEELCQFLRSEARRLNHPPAQKEVFWVMCDYIKRRFKRWPYALKAAGLSKAAGSGGKTMDQMKAEQARREELLEQVRCKAIELGKIPHPKDLPEVCKEINHFYADWGQVIEAAGINGQFLGEKSVYLIENLEPEYKSMLEAVRRQAYSLGRSPIHSEIDENVKQALIRRCGSWRNALYQIGLEPVVRMRPFHGIYIDYRKEGNRSSHTDSLYNCYYRVLNLSEETKKDLEELRTFYERKQIIPSKKDVDRELRIRLQEACGSWANVLYQIGISPEEYRKSQRRQKV